MIVWTDLENFQHRVTRKKGLRPVFARLSKIGKTQILALNTGFAYTYKDNIPENPWVLLLFSKSENAIVFRFLPDGEMKNSRKVSLNTDVRIAITSFLNYFEIDIEKYAGKYIPEPQDLPETGKAWAIFLDKKIKNEKE